MLKHVEVSFIAMASQDAHKRSAGTESEISKGHSEQVHQTSPNYHAENSDINSKPTIFFLHGEALQGSLEDGIEKNVPVPRVNYDGSEGSNVCSILRSMAGPYCVEELEDGEKVLQMILKRDRSKAERVWYIHGGDEALKNILRFTLSSPENYPLCLFSSRSDIDRFPVVDSSSPYIVVGGELEKMMAEGAYSAPLCSIASCLLGYYPLDPHSLAPYPIAMSIFATRGTSIERLLPLIPLTPYLQTLETRLYEEQIAQKVVELLQYCQHLHNHYQWIHCEGKWKYFGVILQHSIPLHTLVYRRPSSDCVLAESEAKALGQLLSSPRCSLHHLHLYGKVSNEGVVHIARGILQNSSLQSLALINVGGIGNGSANALANALITNTVLQELDLSENEITVCPEAFNRCSDSLAINLKGNNIQVPPQQIVDKWKVVGDLKRFYQRSRGQPDSVRLLLVGYGGVGKTRLLCALKEIYEPSDIDFYLEGNISTGLLDISSMPASSSTTLPSSSSLSSLPPPSSVSSPPKMPRSSSVPTTIVSSSFVSPLASFSAFSALSLSPSSPSVASFTKLRVWDFAGQMEYYHIHRHFLPNRSAVYVIVVKLCDGAVEVQKQLNHWLCLIDSQIDAETRQAYKEGMMTKPSVLVVGTHGESLKIGEGWNPNYNLDWLHSIRNVYLETLDVTTSVPVVNYYEWSKTVPRVKAIIKERAKWQLENSLSEWKLTFHLLDYLVERYANSFCVHYNDVLTDLTKAGIRDKSLIKLQSLFKEDGWSVSSLLEEALQYLDLQGFTLYRKQWIFVVPQKLFSVLANLVYLPEKLREERRHSHLRCLKRHFRGEVRLTQIVDILGDEYCEKSEASQMVKTIVEIMIEFKLCSPLSNSGGEETYFFPSHLFDLATLRRSVESGDSASSPEREMLTRIESWQSLDIVEKRERSGVGWWVKEKYIYAHRNHFPNGVFAGIQIRLHQYRERHKTEFIFDGYLVDCAMFELRSGIQVLVRADLSRGIWMVIQRPAAMDTRGIGFLKECVETIEKELKNSYHKELKRELMCPICVTEGAWEAGYSTEGMPLSVEMMSFPISSTDSSSTHQKTSLTYSLMVGRRDLLSCVGEIIFTHRAERSILHPVLRMEAYGFLCETPPSYLSSPSESSEVSSACSSDLSHTSTSSASSTSSTSSTSTSYSSSTCSSSTTAGYFISPPSSPSSSLSNTTDVMQGERSVLFNCEIIYLNL